MVALALAAATALGGLGPVTSAAAGPAFTVPAATAATAPATAVVPRSAPAAAPATALTAPVLATAAGPLAALAAPATAPAAPAASTRTTAKTRILGANRSKTRWFSGVWTGGYMSGARAEAFGRWRGTPTDAVTTYPEYDTWATMLDSEWHVATFDSFTGRLVYGLPMLPRRGGGSLADVAKGRYDRVWRKIATDLVRHRRGNAIVRIGFEGNGDWFRHGGTAATAATYRAAFRRVATTMTRTAPRLVIDFDITCGYSMPGSRHRLDSLTKLYPGDDVVDVVGCDVYDEIPTRARNAREWARALRPAGSPGLADVAAFARAHRKGMTIPEWGVATRGRSGYGDNPYFVAAMRAWMRHHTDVLVLENYFNDTDAHIRSDIWGGQNPRSAAEYRRQW